MSDDMKDRARVPPETVSDALATAATDAQQSSETGAQAGTTRRRFTRASLGVAPVALALMHRPALAQTVCASPSGFESANLSNNPREDLCQGGTPGYWKGTSDKSWPFPYLRYNNNYDGMPPNSGEWQSSETWTYSKSGGTLISAAFGCEPDAYSGMTMMEVLTLNGHQDGYQLGGHLVAALLNAASGWTEPLSVDMVIKIWEDHFCGTGFQPAGASQPWSAEMIVMYLKSTMTRN